MEDKIIIQVKKEIEDKTIIQVKKEVEDKTIIQVKNEESGTHSETVEEDEEIDVVN